MGVSPQSANSSRQIRRVYQFARGFSRTEGSTRRRRAALHIDRQRRVGAAFLFESSWKKPCSERGVRKILARDTQAAGIIASISPHKLRHFLFTWLKTQGIDDVLIQPYSGHATRQSLEIYSASPSPTPTSVTTMSSGDFPV